MIEVGPLRAAIKDLTVVCSRCSQHRDYRDKVIPAGFGRDEEIERVDTGPTPDAAVAQRAIKAAYPVFAALGLTQAELTKAFHESISRP